MTNPKSSIGAAEKAIQFTIDDIAGGSIFGRESSASKALREAAGGGLRSAIRDANVGGVGDRAVRHALTGSLANTAMREAAGGSSVTKAMREAASLTSLTGAISKADKLLRGGSGEREAIESVFGKRTGNLEKAIDEMTGLRGMSSGAIGGLKDRLSHYDTASEALSKTLDSSLTRDPFSFASTDTGYRDLPPMPKNPIHKTNELLDNVVGELTDQRSLIQATAEAQKQETKLLADLVEAFTESQIASDKAARRSQMQAWIGIGIAIITPFLALLISR